MSAFIVFDFEKMKLEKKFCADNDMSLIDGLYKVEGTINIGEYVNEEETKDKTVKFI